MGARQGWKAWALDWPRNQEEAKHVSATIGEGTDVPDDIDVHTTAGKLADYERRIDEAVHAPTAKAQEKQHAKGRRTARERIEMLFDEGTFVELDELDAAGLSATEILEAAAWAPRRFLGAPGLEDGAPADLLVVPADPREDHRILRERSHVVLGGRQVA